MEWWIIHERERERERERELQRGPVGESVMAGCLSGWQALAERSYDTKLPYLFLHEGAITTCLALNGQDMSFGIEV